MRLWSWLQTVIGFIFDRRRVESDMDEEFRSHLKIRAADLERQGLSQTEAERQARIEFGSYQKYKEECREALGTRLLQELAADVLYGLRQLRRNPGFTIVAILTLALGIGANTAIFSVINAVMLKSLPVKDPDQLVLLSWASQKNPTGLDLFSGVLRVGPTGRVTGLPFSYPSFEEFRRGNRVFSGFFGFSPIFSVNFSAAGRANVAKEELVTGDYFSGLGVAPILGRPITSEDEKAGAPSVAVISYGFWSRYFGRNPAAVGKGITINGVPCTVIGVASPQFSGLTPGRAVDVWVPLAQNIRLLPPFLLRTPGKSSPFTSLTSWWVETMGRLKPGVTTRQAQAQLEVLFQQSRRGLNAHAKPQSIPHIHLEPGAKGLALLREKFSTPLWILTVIVGIVLLIACANIAALLVARSAARQAEIALRLSLGASRARLVRQLLTESVLLAGMGGATGVLFAHWASRALVLLMSSSGQPLALVVQLDARVLGFTAAVSIVTGILFGLAPALRSARAGLAPALKGGTSGARSSCRRRRIGLTSPLVATQIALALLLAIGAGLFVRTLKALEGQNLGFDQQHLLLFTVNPERNGYEGERLMDFYSRLRARVQTLPGVKSATMSEEPPVYGNEWNDNVPVDVDGYRPEQGHRLWADWNTVGPSFFKTLGIPLMVGRGIESHDTAASPKVAVVNEAFAREAFKGRNPIGHRVRLGTFTWAGKPEFEIVGMVQDARYASPRKAPWPTVYIPYTQLPTMLGGLNFELRTSGDPLALVPAARGAVHNLDPDLPISEVRTQTQQIDDTLTQERLFGRLSSFFGGLAILLACVGLFGVISYSVNQRTVEIGIRMALGAQKGDVLRMVVLQGLKLTLAGVALGIAGALVLTRFLSSLLYGVKPTDPITFIAVSLILIAVALLACYIPARRAAKVDPMVALRYE